MAQINDLFGRTVVLQLGDTELVNSYSDFKVSFSVEKTLKSEPNTANIEIYGLRRETVANYLAKSTDLRVRLFAGYAGTPSMIFEGYPCKKEGLVFTPGPPDSVLKIKAKDGVRRFERARVELSRADEMTFEDIIVEVAGSLGLTPDVVDLPPATRWTTGATFSDSATNILDRLALAAGAEWSAQNGKFQFLQKASVRPGYAPLFSDELRNIVGAARRKDKGIELTTFIQGAVILGGKFSYRSNYGDLNGDYKITKVRYSGDSRNGSQFYATIEGRDYEDVSEAAARIEREKLEAIRTKVREVIAPADVTLAQFLSPIPLE